MDSFGKKLALYIATSATTIINVFGENEDWVYPSSCKDLTDGEHTLKLMDGDLEDAPLVDLQCSNGFTILDVSKDSDLESYFDTFMQFHHSVAGPTNDVHTNWEGWYKPDDGSSNYVISPDCNTCEYDNQRQLYTKDITVNEETKTEYKTAYMMTGTMFGCFWNLKGEHNFDEDYDTYQCYYTSGEVNDVGESIRQELNDFSSKSDWDSSGVCAFSVRPSNRVLPSPLTHDQCTVDFEQNEASENVYHLKPSIGIEGQYCVCVQPSSTNYYSLNSNEVSKHLNEKKIKKKELINSKLEKINKKTKINTFENIVELRQSDFEEGTYKILESGTYKIMEDIVFDFNANYDEPNSDDAWWPHEEQSDTYPGAGDFHNPYFLGFYAGITVEADNVIIDLNGFELKMSDHFYYQQRWFTTISLLSQYFLPGQGIGFFGADPHFAENVVIKDGTLGLSSHHGIHGHFNKNILIDNVHVKDFETHGIQFNGFEGITIKNCEIGPTAEKSYFKGEYGHARTLLPRFQKVADEYPDEKIQFYGRDEEVTMQDIVDELKKQTDMAYYHVVDGTQYDNDDESWQSAKYLFIDNTGYPNGAAMYGIFLNTYGASVLTYNLYTSFYSSDAKVENVKVHGLRHSMNEYIRMSIPASGNLYMNALHAPFDAVQMLESVSDFSAPRYKGSILTDAALAMEKLSDNWNYKQAQLIYDDKMLDWAFGDNLDGLNDVQIGCNIDVMIHSGKGINAIRVDGVDGVSMENIEVYDIVEKTPLGREECGEYYAFEGECTGACGGHFRQTEPMQIGFSGNMLQGIIVNAAKNVKLKNIDVYDLESETGHTYGISIWPAVDVQFEGDISTKYLTAGSQIEKGTLRKNSFPNVAPEVCGVRVYDSYETNGYTYTANVDTSNVNKMSTMCVNGHYACFNSNKEKSTLGAYWDDNDESCDWEQFTNDNDNDNTNELKAIKGSVNEEKTLYASLNNNIKDESVNPSGDSTNTNNSYSNKLFNNTMIYLLGFLALAMIAVVGGKFVKQWFPIVDYMVEKRGQNSRLNSGSYAQYTQVPNDNDGSYIIA